MRKILVTGAAGFIGKNLCAQLDQEKEVEVLRFESDDSPDKLKQLLGKADFVFHLAGVNRPKNEIEFERGNRDLTRQIVTFLRENGRQTPLLITSSIQAELDNAYGKSKKTAEEAVLDWSKTTGTLAYIYRLPNVFGKWCRPNYNSVVATFCYNIANGLDIIIDNPATRLTLVYIDEVVQDFITALRGEKEISASNYYHVPREFTITLKELADKLFAFRDSRKNLLMPSFESDLDRFIYATYTSYFDTAELGYTLEMKRDERGWLAEFIKSKAFGQVFISRTEPGASRGNHWHHTKVEKFLVIRGEAEIKLRSLHSQEVINYTVRGEDLRVVDIPAGYVHSITNVGKNYLLTMFWSNEIFKPQQPDTYYLEV